MRYLNNNLQELLKCEWRKTNDNCLVRQETVVLILRQNLKSQKGMTITMIIMITDKQTLVYLPNLSKYFLHQRWACICFMFERPEGKGTRIFRTRDNAKWSNLLHGVWCTALPSFQTMYSLHSPVGWSHGNSVIRIFSAILHTRRVEKFWFFTKCFASSNDCHQKIFVF